MKKIWKKFVINNIHWWEFLTKAKCYNWSTYYRLQLLSKLLVIVLTKKIKSGVKNMLVNPVTLCGIVLVVPPMIKNY